MKDLKWFLDRVGQEVFRDNQCACHECIKMERNGEFISDNDHAQYMYVIQNKFEKIGEDLNYRDKK